MGDDPSEFNLTEGDCDAAGRALSSSEGRLCPMTDPEDVFVTVSFQTGSSRAPPLPAGDAAGDAAARAANVRLSSMSGCVCMEKAGGLTYEWAGECDPGLLACNRQSLVDGRTGPPGTAPCARSHTTQSASAAHRTLSTASGPSSPGLPAAGTQMLGRAPQGVALSIVIQESFCKVILVFDCGPRCKGPQHCCTLLPESLSPRIVTQYSPGQQDQVAILAALS